MNQTSDIKRLDALTGLKAVCCLMIVFYHTFKPTAENLQGIVSFINTYFADFGNTLFFLISGFLMAYFYRERISKKEITFSKFIVKKLIKLYPLFLISNVVCMFVAIGDDGIQAFDINRFISMIFIANGGTLEYFEFYNFPAWFAGVVLWCYVVYFFVAYHTKENNTFYYSLLVLLVILGYVALGHSFNIPFFYDLTGKGYQNFFMGCILADVYKSLKNNKKIEYGALIALALFLLLAVIDDRGFGEYCGSFPNVVAFFLGPILVYILLTNGFINAVFAAKPMYAFGKISISMFYWHVVLSWFYSYTIKDVIIDSSTYFVYYLFYWISLILICIVSYVLIESRLSGLLNKQLLKRVS